MRTHTKGLLAEQTVELLWKRLKADGLACNWGTALDNSIWNIDDDAYINGVMMHLDLDYEGLYLVEVVVREPNEVMWLAVAYGSFKKQAWAWMPVDRHQTFFDRSVTQFDCYRWAIDWYEANPELESSQNA